MAQFTLDDIRSATEKKYGSTDIVISESETLHLLNVLRLPKAKRDEFQAIVGKLSKKDEDELAEIDQLAIFSDALIAVSDDEKLCRKVLDSVGDDLGQLATIFSMYSEGTSAGEA